jgi:hypothetical protein
MGIFQQRPEEPTEWAGLPADPWEPRAPAEILPDPVATEIVMPGSTVPIESITISLSPAPSAGADGHGED